MSESRDFVNRKECRSDALPVENIGIELEVCPNNEMHRLNSVILGQLININPDVLGCVDLPIEIQ